MKIKATINFKTLRDKGPSALDIKEDEIVQITTKNEVLCIVTQDYLQSLIHPAPTSDLLPRLDKTFNFQGSSRLNSKISSNILGSSVSLNFEKSLEDRVADLEKEIKDLKKNKEGHHGRS